MFAYDSETGIFFNSATVKRDNVFHYAAVDVVHEWIDPQGSRHIRFLIDVGLAETYDVSQLGALAELPRAPGWSYESRVLAAPLEVGVEDGVAVNVGQAQLGVGVLTAWQRYAVPEPATLLRFAGGLAALGAARRSRRP